MTPFITIPAFLISLASVFLAGNSFLVGMCVGCAVVWAWDTYRYFQPAS